MSKPKYKPYIYFDIVNSAGEERNPGTADGAAKTQYTL